MSEFKINHKRVIDRLKSSICSDCNISRAIVESAYTQYLRQSAPMRVSDALMYRDVLKNPELNIYVSLLYSLIKNRISLTEFDRVIEKVNKTIDKMKEVSV